MLAQEPMGSVDWAQTGIIAVLVISALLAGLRGKWMFRWQHDAIVRQIERERDRERAEKEEWKTLALTQAGIVTQTVEKATRIVERVVASEPSSGHGGTA